MHSGNRFLPKPGGWLAAAILLGIPILPLWGNAAYTDMAWALFQFLAVVLLVRWKEGRKLSILVLSGISQGLALGSKYSAFSGLLVLALIIFWIIMKDRGKPARVANLLKSTFAFSFSALIVASPWYIKNMLWTGNPLYPFVFSQHGTDPIQLKMWLEYMGRFGVGRRFFDYVLLPMNIFVHHEKFGTFMSSMEMPNPIFLLVLLYPFIRYKIEAEYKQALDIFAIISVMLFTAWAAGYQQIRFLLPLFPIFSILAASVFLSIQRGMQNQKIARIVVLGFTGGMIIATLVFMGIYQSIVRPEQVLLGNESKAGFLSRMVRDYSGIEYVNDKLPDDAKVLFLWDARGYYCAKNCMADINQSEWVARVQRSGNIKEVSNQLQKENVTHLFFSKEDASYFLLKHDENKLNEDATRFLIREVCA